MMRVTRSTWFVPTATVTAWLIAVTVALGPTNAFAHENHWLLIFRRSLVFENNQPGRILAALSNRQ